MDFDVWPARVSFRPGDRVELQVRSETAVEVGLAVQHLGRTVRTAIAQLHPGLTTVGLGEVETGGYGVSVTIGSERPPVAWTAFDVLARPTDRPRYGFVCDFAPDRADLEVVVRGAQQLHLTCLQFYDWAYRHADLIGADEVFTDTLGRVVSHSVVRELVARLSAVGAASLGYAAVYGAGKEHADSHAVDLLYHADGSPWMLGDFLWIANLDPARSWRSHILGEFVQAVRKFGFTGLHLDQYGSPKFALDSKGEPVDLAEQFPSLIDEVRQALPASTLIFNNVNDYPTWATATTAQNATYIEVWDPHSTYAHLARLLETARQRSTKPVILAAYLEPFAKAPAVRSAAAASLALATVFSHGGHYLLCGEGDGVLTEAYYPHFHRVDAAGYALVRNYFDFAVAMGDLLYDPDAVDVTYSHAGGDNEDVHALSQHPVSVDPVPGRLWLQVRRHRNGTAIHVIDLTAQSEIDWNRDKNPLRPVKGLRLRVRAGPAATARAGSPDRGPFLCELPAARDHDHLVAEVPAFTAWAVIQVGDRG